MNRFCVSAALAVATAAACAHSEDYRPTFRPEALKASPVGKLNEILVLGTPHLSSLPASFNPQLLRPLLDRLAAWHPTGIATEDVSGLECDNLRRYPSRYAETVKNYCFDPAEARRATGLDVPTANAEVERLLQASPASPSAAERRHLAAIFLAAGEPNSALVQWLRMPMPERHVGDGLDDALVATLNALTTRRNESGLIGAALAARLALERTWSVDDHSADTPDSPDPAERKAAEAAILGAWNNRAAHKRHDNEARLLRSIAQSGGLLALYQAFNSPAAMLLAYRSDFGAALVEPSSQQFGRAYVGFWETRNLRMVANIRDVIGRHPGMRMLAIVGASHKGYYEAYLQEMHDARLVDAKQLLR